jgi:hypothetical protein
MNRIDGNEQALAQRGNRQQGLDSWIESGPTTPKPDIPLPPEPDVPGSPDPGEPPLPHPIDPDHPFPSYEDPPPIQPID